MKILLVEDSKELLEAMAQALIDEGYTVDQAQDGNKGYEYAMVNGYDILILDLNLPNKSGYEIAKAFRKDNSTTPIMAVTARDALPDKLKGFDLGFDDYLTKPFEIPELMARVRALIRRSKPNKKKVIETHNLKIDSQSRKVMEGKKEIDLTKTEFNILEYLVRHQGLVVENGKLIEAIWGEDADLLDPPVRSHVKNLRKKIGDDNMTIIKTVPGVGYIIE
ncbi:response regulator transcription factor [Candidatus Dojkabacteria bacterium]|nr:response regulator transcription factor [Candidatus Dojkabacteria bacterium]